MPVRRRGVQMNLFALKWRTLTGSHVSAEHIWRHPPESGCEHQVHCSRSMASHAGTSLTASRTQWGMAELMVSIAYSVSQESGTNISDLQIKIQSGGEDAIRWLEYLTPMVDSIHPEFPKVVADQVDRGRSADSQTRTPSI
eukprot:100032-Amphidinium_carterae.1